MNKSATIKELLTALTEDMNAEDILSAIICSGLSTSIVKKRLEMGMSQKELADEIGKTQSTISKWENGDMNFTVDLLAEIAVKLGLELIVELKDKEKVQHSGNYSGVHADSIMQFDEFTVFSTGEYPAPLAEI